MSREPSLPPDDRAPLAGTTREPPPRLGSENHSGSLRPAGSHTLAAHVGAAARHPSEPSTGSGSEPALKIVRLSDVPAPLLEVPPRGAHPCPFRAVHI